MKKLKTLVTILLIGVITLSGNLVFADGVGNVAITVPSAPGDFSSVIVVTLTAFDTPGYTDAVNKVVELSLDNWYTGAAQGIPAGSYIVQTSMYQYSDPNKTPYTDPNYSVKCPGTIQLLAGQIYDLTISLVPTVQVGTETAAPVATASSGTTEVVTTTTAPTALPAATANPGPVSIFGNLLYTIIRGNIITIILLLIACGIWLYIRIRKTMYKE